MRRRGISPSMMLAFWHEARMTVQNAAIGAGVLYAWLATHPEEKWKLESKLNHLKDKFKKKDK